MSFETPLPGKTKTSNNYSYKNLLDTSKFGQHNKGNCAKVENNQKRVDQTAHMYVCICITQVFARRGSQTAFSSRRDKLSKRNGILFEKDK